MLTRRDIINHCLTYPDAYEDYPFRDANWTVMRVLSNKKLFAAIYERNGALCVNVKCDPLRALFLRDVFPERVLPAYHMNKEHWNTIVVAPPLAEADLYDMIAHSYALVRPHSKPRRTTHDQA
nr:MmcQ/YjbR family DNA-binding protein [Maliibacterium massiliense]